MGWLGEQFNECETRIIGGGEGFGVRECGKAFPGSLLVIGGLGLVWGLWLVLFPRRLKDEPLTSRL